MGTSGWYLLLGVESISADDGRLAVHFASERVAVAESSGLMQQARQLPGEGL